MTNGGNHPLVQPIDMASGDGFGWFRIPNAKQFSQYLSGRFYDQVFYAPKDRVRERDPRALPRRSRASSSTALGTSDVVWSSYCLSPAAPVQPRRAALGRQDPEELQEPLVPQWRIQGSGAGTGAVSRRSRRTWSSITGSSRPRGDCNPGFEGGTYDNCEPYYFNLAFESVPMSLFYDGHVEGLGVREARAADRKSLNQSGHGLWSRDTPYGEDGYFMDVSYDNPSGPGMGTSFHIFTTDGILGRDKTK